MMIKYLLISIFLTGLMSPVYAGIDQVFGGKQSWWSGYYNSLLGSLGIEKSYALVIGVSNYNDNNLQPLPSEKDAVRMKNYLINEAGFDHVRLITGDKVTIDRVRKLMFDYYPGLLTSKDRFLFYWSGHGVSVGDQHKQGFLAVQNSQENHVSTMVSMHDLAHWDRRFKAKQILYLLDACFSGIATATPMSPSRDQTINRVSRPSRQVLVAGAHDEQTIALDDIGGGVFTRALLDGLRGRADTNKDVFRKDGVVTAHELVEYVREHVERERLRVGWRSTITPKLTELPRKHQKGDFFFVTDKRVLKKPQALKQRSQTNVIATGSHVNSQQTKQLAARTTQSRRYIDNGNGTITNTETGQMWKKCSEGQAGNTCFGRAYTYTWHEAMDRFKKVSFAGYDDWRIPTINELVTLVPCGGGKHSYLSAPMIGEYVCVGSSKLAEPPTISTSEFPNTPAKWYWSSQNGNDGHAWGLLFYSGVVSQVRKDYDGYPVRLVRGH